MKLSPWWPQRHGQNHLVKSLVGMIAHKTGWIILDKQMFPKLKSYERIGADVRFVPWRMIRPP